VEWTERNQSAATWAQRLVLLNQGNKIAAFLDPELSVLETVHGGQIVIRIAAMSSLTKRDDQLGAITAGVFLS